MIETLGGIILVAFIVFLVILLMRELVCWYFKISLMNQNLDLIDLTTKEIRKFIFENKETLNQSFQDITSMLATLNQIAEEQLAVLKKLQSVPVRDENQLPLISTYPTETEISVSAPCATDNKEETEIVGSNHQKSDSSGVPKLENESGEEYVKRVKKLYNNKISFDL